MKKRRPRQANEPDLAPADMQRGSEQHRMWWRTIRALERQGTWNRETDCPLLEQYVRCVFAAREARQTLAEDGLTVPTLAGQPKPHPLVRVCMEHEAAARQIAAALLLTPEARRKAGVEVTAHDDELAALIGGAG